MLPSVTTTTVCTDKAISDVDDEFKLHDDTVRNLEVLAHAPGDLKFRLALAQSISNIHTEIKMMRQEMNQRLNVIERRKLIGDVRVAEIAIKEMAPLKIDVERLWNAGKWVVITILGTVIVVTVTALLTKAPH